MTPLILHRSVSLHAIAHLLTLFPSDHGVPLLTGPTIDHAMLYLPRGQAKRHRAKTNGLDDAMHTVKVQQIHSKHFLTILKVHSSKSLLINKILPMVTWRQQLFFMQHSCRRSHTPHAGPGASHSPSDCPAWLAWVPRRPSHSQTASRILGPAH